MIVMEHAEEKIVIATPSLMKEHLEELPDQIMFSESTTPSSSDDENSSAGSFCVCQFSDDDAHCNSDLKTKSELSREKADDTFISIASDDATFANLRWSYLCVMLVVMLADGLQGKLVQK